MLSVTIGISLLPHSKYLDELYRVCYASLPGTGCGVWWVAYHVAMYLLGWHNYCMKQNCTIYTIILNMVHCINCYKYCTMVNMHFVRTLTHNRFSTCNSYQKSRFLSPYYRSTIIALAWILWKHGLQTLLRSYCYSK